MQKTTNVSTLLLTLLISTYSLIGFSAEVNLYSARKEALIKPVLDIFTKKTGIKVNLVTGKADVLLKRLKTEGRNSPADLLLTTDAGRLHRAKVAGVLQPVKSATLAKVIPASYRDPENYWFGLSLRSRVVLYVKGKVNVGDLSTYEGLSDQKWHGKICVRSSNNIYNQSLVASMIASHGEVAAEKWAKGFVNNFSRPPRGGDRDQIKAAAAGECDLAIANTYYFGKMLKSNDKKQLDAATKMGLFWPNQGNNGAHVNVSGIGLTKVAKHQKEAVQLMEFLVSLETQKWYAEANYEYPVRGGVELNKTLKSWGAFKADVLNLSKLGEFNPAAVKVMDRAGWK